MAGPELMFTDETAVPGTHALVIGVGEYPHVEGGTAPAVRQDGLRQLSSPPASALAIAEWLLRHYRCPGRELASLSLLVSAPGGVTFTNRTGMVFPVPTADIATIVAAVRDWKVRGDGDPGNRLIFYFCGHGTSEGDDMALLARGFSLDDPNPLDNALDFRQLVNGLRQCAAEQQVFLVDACRASSDVLISQSGGRFAGQVPLLGGGLPRREAITYYAALAGELSHARPKQVSLFTEAVLRALRGAGSDDPHGDWWVTTSRLHDAVDHFMKQPTFAGAAAGVQTPAVNAMPVFDVHRLDGDPEVPVYVSCNPAADNPTATFVCRVGGIEKHRRDVGSPVDPADADERWLLNLPSGDYEFEATIDANDRRVISRAVRPVYRTVELGRAP